jgi:hypothetical protein
MPQRYAVIEVQAGTVLGVPNAAYHRRWDVHADDALAARRAWADRMTEALHYLGQLPLPQDVRWINVHTQWV